VVAKAETWPCAEPPELIFQGDFAAVVQTTDTCVVVVVDMPIGLPSGADPRSCDLLAREALGGGGQGRVFLTPPRQALRARSVEEFLSLHRTLTGRGPGLPVWGIVPKLREVEAVVTPDLQKRVMEFHPELLWKRLAGRVLASKHGARGTHQRLTVLAQHGVSWLLRLDMGKLPDAVALDDVLDSIIGLPVANSVARDPMYKRRLPAGDPPKDERGLRMEIWF